MNLIKRMFVAALAAGAFHSFEAYAEGVSPATAGELPGRPLTVLRPSCPYDKLGVYDPLLENTSDIDDQSRKHYFDLGTPKVVTGIRFRGRTWSQWTSRMVNRTLWGSNVFSTDSLEGWTLIASNHLTEAEMAADFASGNDSVIPAYPGTGAYRYYRITEKSKNGNAYVDASRLYLYSADTAVRAYRPVLWSDVQQLNSPIPAGGIGFDGLLTCSPTGKAEAYVAVSAEDYGDDFTAWQANGTVTAGGEVTEGTRFTVNVPAPTKGCWYSRLFVKVGDVYTASQETMDFFVGTKASYPVAYMATTYPDNMYVCYNGNANLSNAKDNTESGIQMFFRVNQDGNFVTSLRFWPRITDRTSDTTRYTNYLSRFRKMKIEVAEDEIDWSGVTVTPYENALNRELYKLSVTDGNTAAATVTWTNVGTIYDFVHETYDGPIEISLAHPKINKKIKYVRLSGAAYWAIAEVEFRTMHDAGFVILFH